MAAMNKQTLLSTSTSSQVCLDKFLKIAYISDQENGSIYTYGYAEFSENGEPKEILNEATDPEVKSVQGMAIVTGNLFWYGAESDNLYCLP